MQVDKHLLEKFPHSDINTRRGHMSTQSNQTGYQQLQGSNASLTLYARLYAICTIM